MLTTEEAVKRYGHHYFNFLAKHLTNEQRDNLYEEWQAALAQKHFPFIESSEDFRKGNPMTAADILDKLFSWSNSNQGYEYWSRIDNMLNKVPTKFAPPNAKQPKNQPQNQPQNQKENTIMNKRIITATFINSSAGNYSFFTDIQDLKQDDIVVVDT